MRNVQKNRTEIDLTRVIIFLQVIIIPLGQLSGQTTTSLDFILGVQSSYRALRLSTEAENTESISLRNLLNIERSDRAQRESYSTALTVGVNYNFKLRTFFLKTGFRFTQVGYKAPFLASVILTSVAQVIGFPDWKYYWFAEIPFVFRYEFSTSKITPFIEFGSAYYFYLATSIDDSIEVKKVSGINRINLSVNCSVGMNYQLSKRLQLFFQPTFQLFVLPLRDQLIHEHIYRFGVEIGIRKSLSFKH